MSQEHNDRLQILKADITTLYVDAIANAAEIGTSQVQRLLAFARRLAATRAATAPALMRPRRNRQVRPPLVRARRQ